MLPSRQKGAADRASLRWAGPLAELAGIVLVIVGGIVLMAYDNLRTDPTGGADRRAVDPKRERSDALKCQG